MDDIAKGIGPSTRMAIYSMPDDQLAVGSTLGGPLVCTIIKATGAIEKVFDIATGMNLFGTLVLHYWDERTGMNLDDLRPGTFTIHPEHQEHHYPLSNGLMVRENVFVLNSGAHEQGEPDPPAVYYTVELRNDAGEEMQIGTYAFCRLRGDTAHDIEATYGAQLRSILAWN